MIVDVEKKEAIEALNERWEKVLNFLDVDGKEARLKLIREQLSDDSFWQSGQLDQAQALQREAKEIERALGVIHEGKKVLTSFIYWDSKECTA